MPENISKQFPAQRITIVNWVLRFFSLQNLQTSHHLYCRINTKLAPKPMMLHRSPPFENRDSAINRQENRLWDINLIWKEILGIRIFIAQIVGWQSWLTSSSIPQLRTNASKGFCSSFPVTFLPLLLQRPLKYSFWHWNEERLTTHDHIAVTSSVFAAQWCHRYDGLDGQPGTVFYPSGPSVFLSLLCTTL